VIPRNRSLAGIGRPLHVRHVEARFASAGRGSRTWRRVALSGAFWRFFEGAHRRSLIASRSYDPHPVTDGTLFVTISVSRSPTPFRPDRTTDKIVATPRRYFEELAFLASKVAQSSRSALRRWHEGSEDCRFAVCAIFETFVQSSRSKRALTRSVTRPHENRAAPVGSPAGSG
jgi:hypothetical protein